MLTNRQKLSFKKWRKKWQVNNREYLRQYRKEYFKKNKERTKETRRLARQRYYQKHREAIILKLREYRKKNKPVLTATERCLHESKRCISCEILMKRGGLICNWCTTNYPHLYSHRRGIIKRKHVQTENRNYI